MKLFLQENVYILSLSNNLIGDDGATAIALLVEKLITLQELE